MTNLPDYSKITFPDTQGVPYKEIVPEATDAAVNLLSQFIIYDSAKRLGAKEALGHKYFYEKPFPARLDEMNPPPEKRMGTQNKEYATDIPFHKHFEKLLNLHS